MRVFFTAAIVLLALSPAATFAMERISVANDGRGFQAGLPGQPFTPWGFNYDHDAEGRLLEDYWNSEWDTVEADFREMKQLGANVVRIHLQFGRFMESPTRPRQAELDQLARLIRLAEKTELYLNITGLGCYHRKDVPAWYDALEEEPRWQAQAAFWQAVASVCSGSPAVFCYDLMNEPVVAAGTKERTDWLGPAFGGKHFVQAITRNQAGRERPDVARLWIQTLVAAIRKEDSRHLITVGLVPWSLDQPGLTSGFVPGKIASELDFVSVHLYPEAGKVDEAIQTLKAFAVAGKPVVIEETFPLKGTAEDMERFLLQSRQHAAGWFGFYWGQTPDELRTIDTPAASITRAWLALFEDMTPRMLSQKEQQRPRTIACEGTYRHHLQGICTDGKAIYWSFTTTLVKTDMAGRRLKQIPVANHHGDLCHRDGQLYVAVNLGRFNDPKGNADSWVYVYDAKSLKETARHETQEVFHGAGGIGFRDGHFFVVGGLPDGVEENYVYEYDSDFRFQKKHTLRSGHTRLGIQTATFAHGKWWFGCYGTPPVLLVTDANFQLEGRYEFPCSLGIEGLPGGQLLSASGSCLKDSGCSGSLRTVVPEEKAGLKVLE